MDGNKDLKGRLIAPYNITYLQKVGVISDGEGGVCDDTTEGDVQMGRGPI